MQALIVIRCGECYMELGRVHIDTADMPDQLQQKINEKILAHREDCIYHRCWIPVIRE